MPTSIPQEFIVPLLELQNVCITIFFSFFFFWLIFDTNTLLISSQTLTSSLDQLAKPYKQDIDFFNNTHGFNRSLNCSTSFLSLYLFHNVHKSGCTSSSGTAGGQYACSQQSNPLEMSCKRNHKVPPKKPTIYADIRKGTINQRFGERLRRFQVSHWMKLLEHNLVYVA